MMRAWRSHSSSHATAASLPPKPCPRELGREIAPQRRRIVLAACVLASSMAFIDGSALTVALPKLRAFFGADLATVQWVLNGYVLALAALTLIGGALADHYGKARMLAVGCVGFGLASVACVVAPTIGWLIACRVAQGVSAAILTPASLALIGATYPKEERSRAIGVWAAASSLTTAGGPVLGGWLTENFGWQWVFAINPPLAAIAVALLIAVRPARSACDAPVRYYRRGHSCHRTWRPGVGAQPDRPGQGGRKWRNDRARCRHSASRRLLAYALWERVSPSPMTPPRLIDNRPFVGLNIATLLIYTGLSIMFFSLSFDLVDRRGLTPTGAGLAFLPFTLAMGFLSQPFGALADKIGARRLLIVGPLGAGFALLLLALGKNASLTLGVLAPMLLLGISFALVVAPLTASVMSSVANSDEGLASGINNAMSRIAQLAGIALLGRHRVICIRLQSGIDHCRDLRRCRRCDHCSHAAGTGAPALDTGPASESV